MHADDLLRVDDGFAVGPEAGRQLGQLAGTRPLGDGPPGETLPRAKVPESDILFLKHDSSIVRHSSDPVCGFSPSMSVERLQIEHDQLNKTIEQKTDSTKVN